MMAEDYTYADPSDKKYQRTYVEHTPDALKAFTEFNAAVFGADRAIPRKYLELIAVAVASTTQCAYCLDAHTAGAVEAGATDQEIAEAVWVSAALRAGASFAHGRLAFKLVEHHRNAE